MKNKFIQTSNVSAFLSLAERLNRVEAGVPGMGLIHGVKGLGKTTAAIHYAGQKGNRSVYVRAKSNWTYTWMMEDLLIELGATPVRGEKAKYDAMVSALVESPRLVIIDEANLIKPALLETLRAIHDTTCNPVLFVGHEGVVGHLIRLGPLYDRLLYITELKPLGLADLEKFCAGCLEVEVGREVLENVLKECDGNFRRSVVALKRLEDQAKASRLSVNDVAPAKKAGAA